MITKIPVFFITPYSSLNDFDSLAWEPVHSGQEKDTGRIAVWPIDWNHFQPDHSPHQKKERINQALHTSVKEFHESWHYELYRFNCEHWARLIATGDCRCYQIAEFKKLDQIPVVGFLIVGVAGAVTGAWEHNGYAQEIIEKAYLGIDDVSEVSAEVNSSNSIVTLDQGDHKYETVQETIRLTFINENPEELRVISF